MKRRSGTRRRGSLLVLFLAMMLVPYGAIRADERICFPEAAPVIRDCIEGRFVSFWRDNGGLPVFGYPITNARYETNPDTGQKLLVQYFERQRFELHPENQPPYDVLLGRLGAVYLAVALEGRAGFPQDPSMPHYVPETGYTIGTIAFNDHPEGPWYWDYWSSHGLEFDGQPGKSWSESLMLFGYPISSLRTNLHDLSSFQVYERTVLRYQPGVTDPAWRIIPDRIGVWYYKYLGLDPENRLRYP